MKTGRDEHPPTESRQAQPTTCTWPQAFLAAIAKVTCSSLTATASQSPPSSPSIKPPHQSKKPSLVCGAALEISPKQGFPVSLPTSPSYQHHAKKEPCLPRWRGCRVAPLFCSFAVHERSQAGVEAGGCNRKASLRIVAPPCSASKSVFLHNHTKVFSPQGTPFPSAEYNLGDPFLPGGFPNC